MLLDVTAVRTDGGTQTRAELNLEHVNDIADAARAKKELPAIVVFFDGTHYWLGDGFHRLAGVIAACLGWIEADVRQGTRRDAVLFSVGANASHGLKRSNADKRRAVETLLRDPEWAQWSDREIARQCNVDHKSVAKLRHGTNGEIPNAAAHDDARKCVDGRNYPAKRSPAPSKATSVPSIDTEENLADVIHPSTPPLAVPSPELPPEPEARKWSPHELTELVRVVLNACHDQHEVLDALEKRVSEAFANVEPRFSVDMRQRCEHAVAGLAKRLNDSADAIAANIPNDEPARRFGVIQGGRT